MRICAECDYTGNKAGFSAHYRHSGHDPMKKFVSGEVIACATCGNDFYKYKNKRYCSAACAPVGPVETFTCRFCGKESMGYPGKQYCSRKCSAQGQKTKKCGQCDFTSQHYSRFTSHQARTGHSKIKEPK